jgi:hypothetical protein
MKANRNKQTDLISGITSWAENTTSYHAVPNRYWAKKWFRKANYHLVFTYLISQAKYNNTDKLSVGQCSFGIIELSNFLNIPRATIHYILEYLQKENEISLKTTNKFTIVTINYLTKSPSSKTQKSVIKNTKVRYTYR